MADFLHTNSWMVHRPAGVKSLGRVDGLVLFERPQRIPREGPGGFLTEVTTPSPWRRAFLWRPIKAIEIRHGGTIVEGWAWLRRVERRTHFGPRAADDVIEIRARPAPSTELVSG
jgi:hypothetical protein